MVTLLYLLVAAVVMLPGLVHPCDWTGTEARRVQIASEMLSTGSWFVPTLGFEPTLVKPPLHYWILAAIVDQVGPAIWLLRVPPVLAFAGLARLSHGIVLRTHGRGAGYAAGLGILTAPLVAVLAPRAEIDPLFAAITAASLLCIAYGAAFTRRSWLLVGGLLGGLALIDKGPPYLLFFAGTLLVWLRRRRASGVRWALLGMGLLPALWLFAVMQSSATTDALLDSAMVESVGRVGLFQWEDAIEIPLFLARAVLISLPFGFFLFHEYRGERPASPDGPELFVRLCAAAAFSAVILLVFFPARPARYLLPAVPLFVVAVSPSVAAYARRATIGRPMRLTLGCVAAFFAVLGAIVPWLPASYGPGNSLALFAVAAFALWVRTPRAVVAGMLALTPVATWIGVADAAEHRAINRDSFAHPGRVLADAVAGRRAEDLTTFLHVPSQALLHAGLLPRGDELARRPPGSRWLLMEAGAVPLEAWRHVARVSLPLTDYVPRVRIQLARRDLLLMERQPR